MGTPDINAVNFILNAIQTGGLVSTLVLGVLAFARGWVYPSKTVDKLEETILRLTATLDANNASIDKMADAWEARNQMERERQMADMNWDRRQRQRGE